MGIAMSRTGSAQSDGGAPQDSGDGAVQASAVEDSSLTVSVVGARDGDAGGAVGTTALTSAEALPPTVTTPSTEVPARATTREPSVIVGGAWSPQAARPMSIAGAPGRGVTFATGDDFFR